MKLYFARHGQSTYNALGLCNSDPSVDVHLTPLGIQESEALAEKLKNIPLDHMFASELRRTQQTAAIVNQFHNLKIAIDPLLNDHRSGFEGKPFAELVKALDAAPDRWTARFNGGESIDDMKARVADFLQQLRTTDYQSVLIVTSLWIIYAAAAIIKDISNEAAWQLDAPQGSYLLLEL